MIELYNMIELLTWENRNCGIKRRAAGPCVKHLVWSQTMRNWIYQLQSKEERYYTIFTPFYPWQRLVSETPSLMCNLLLAALPRTTKDARDALRGTHAKIHRCGLTSVSFRWMSGNKNSTRAWSESRNVSVEIEWMNRPATLIACLALICSQSLFTSSTPVKIQRVDYVKFMHCSDPLKSPQQ